jgi:hypothetical protein
MTNTYKKTTDPITDRWLTTNGLNPKTFAATEVILLRAQKATYRILKQYGNLLSAKQTMILNQFRLAIMSSKQRDCLTARHAYKILNIATSVNRQAFRQHKKIIRKQTLIKVNT